MVQHDIDDLVPGTVRLSGGVIDFLQGPLFDADAEMGAKPAASNQKKQTAAKQKAREQEAKERQEAYAQHDGYTGAQGAFDAGDKSVDPDLLNK